jgi:predicted NBD/HSP70 family sugar kinase
MEAIQVRDPYAVEIFNETVDDLGFALSHVVQLFHPGIIVLGGGLSFIGEPLCVALSNKIVNYLMDAFQPGPPIVLSALKADAVPLGCLVLARQQLNL